MSRQFLRSVSLKDDGAVDRSVYPFMLPAIRKLTTIEFHPQVTFFVGENGTGKSTLVEAIALALGFNAEGGGRNFNFATRRSESGLYRHLRVSRGIARPRDGYFLRAESYYNVATEIENLDKGPGSGPPIIDSYGGVSLHEQSHGESFMALLKNRLGGQGLYIFDEPEAALSPTRQLTMLRIMHRLATEQNSQFIIATHSPILLAYPHSKLLHLSEEGIHETLYQETEHFLIMREVLRNPQGFMARLLADDADDTRDG